jgi:hypothetical protein
MAVSPGVDYSYLENPADRANYERAQLNRAPANRVGGFGLTSSRETRGPRGETQYVSEYGPSQEDTLALRDKYNAAAEARMMQSLGGVFGSGGGGGTAPPISRVGGPIAEKELAARNAAFARAKESAANNAQAALAGLRNTMGRRGFQGGGGYADMKTAEALAPAANQVNEFTREQQIQDLDSARRNADTEYGGAITQRGQTLGAETARRNSLIGLISSGRGYY